MQRERGVVWVTPPPPDLVCSVCTDVFTEPIVLACGHSFCRSCAAKWFTNPSRLCPAARCPASANSKPASLPAAFSLKGVVESLLQYCPYGVRRSEEGELIPDPHGCGCTAQLGRAEAAAHN